MAAALECWSSRASTDEDMVEQVLMRTNARSEATAETSSANGGSKEYPSVMQKRFQRLSRNVSEAIASLKNSLNLDPATAAGGIRDPTLLAKTENSRKVVWGSVVRNLTQLYPGSQLPEKLVSNIRRHYDSLPLRSVCTSVYSIKNFSSYVWLPRKRSKLNTEEISFLLPLIFLSF